MINLNDFAYSDCTLETLHGNHQSLVRKTFRTDLARAKCNVEKQRLFHPLYIGMARLGAAEVLEFKVNANCAELLMHYVQGMTGHTFPVQATRSLAQTLSSSLSKMLYFELDESREATVSTSLFRDKLVSVSAATRDPDLKRLLDDCHNIVDTFSSEMSFPLGPCHGDLTLSNLILDPVMGITLIDFLCTFLESPLQDVAKLKQDFVYGWSFRNNPPALRIKAEIFCRHHFPEAIVQIERTYPSQVYLLTLMTLARIAPYVKDAITKQWLVHSLTDCLKDFSLCNT